MEQLYFTSTRLRVSGKQGILKPDEEGYYILPIGAFNCVSSRDEFYTSENIDKIFDSSSDLMRKIESGKLFGEWGHPDIIPGESDNTFMNRACRVNDKDTCVFFKDVWTDSNISPEMLAHGVPSNAIVTMARLKPMGKLWETLDRSLKDPNVNTTFSGRFLTRDKQIRGQTHVIVESIVTWDAVTDQGIPAAEKWLSPRLESNKKQITPKIISALKQKVTAGGIRMENVEAVKAIIKTAETFFNSAKNKERGYREW